MGNPSPTRIQFGGDRKGRPYAIDFINGKKTDTFVSVFLYIYLFLTCMNRLSTRRVVSGDRKT